MTPSSPPHIGLAAAWFLSACAAPHPHLPGIPTAGHCGLEQVQVHVLGME